MSIPPRIAPEDHIPLFQKVMFSLGQNTDYVATGLMTTVIWMPFFNIGMGMNPVVLGLILMVLRAWDAVADPVFGNISDNTRTRWGRRRPFMFVAAITTAALFPLMWYFPASVLDGTSWLARVADWIPFLDRLNLSASDKATSIYLVIVGCVFFTSFSCWSMPYYGLQLELTPNYDERTRLTAMMSLVAKLTSLVFGWMFVAIVLVGTIAKGDLTMLDGKPAWMREFLAGIQPLLNRLAGGHAGEKPIVLGMHLMCWVIALMILVLGILPAIFVRERYYEKESRKQAREPFWQSIRESLRCGPLWPLIAASFFVTMGNSAVGALGQYVSIYYVCGGDIILAGTIGGIKGSVLAVCGICMIPFYTWMGERYDKRTTVLVMLGVSMFGHLLNYTLMTPAHPCLQIISGFFESSAVSAVWMFMPSMKADVADWDEQHTTRRREGAINAFYSWFIKASLTASLGIGGVVLQVTGFQANLPQQPQFVLHKMFALYLTLPVAIWLLALASVWFYPLTRACCADIRLALEARRGAI